MIALEELNGPRLPVVKSMGSHTAGHHRKERDGRICRCNNLDNKSTNSGKSTFAAIISTVPHLHPPTSWQSSVMQPPVMPRRKERQGIHGDDAGSTLDDISEARDTFPMMPEYKGGALPPVQPQRLESLETTASSGSLIMSYNNNVQGSYRQQTYNRVNG